MLLLLLLLFFFCVCVSARARLCITYKLLNVNHSWSRFFNPETASAIVKLDILLEGVGESAGDIFVVVIYDVIAGLQMTVDGFSWRSVCHPIWAAAAPFIVW